MNNIIEVNFKVDDEILITELEKDNWFEVLDGGYLLVGKAVRMECVDFEELFG